MVVTMASERLISLSNTINKKDYDKLLDVLKEYNITPASIERIRSAYKVVCADRCYCLKKINHGDKKALKGLLLVEYLKSHNFNNVVNYIPTINGSDSVKTKTSIYYLMDWVEGRECDFDNEEELKNAVKLLGEFHKSSTGFNPDKLRIDSNIKNWPGYIEFEVKEMLHFKGYIERKKIKTQFDFDYYYAVDAFLPYMNLALELLTTSDYISTSSSAKEQHTICHDSFYYQNILIDSNNQMYLIDLDSVVYDIHVYDLAKFIRRILYKKQYSWNFEFAKTMIEIYSEINPLNKEDYKILLAFLIIQHKFWKLGRKRYRKGKKWSEDKYVHKLRKLMRYRELQSEFIEKFKQYYDIK